MAHQNLSIANFDYSELGSKSSAEFGNLLIDTEQLCFEQLLVKKNKKCTPRKKFLFSSFEEEDFWVI